MNCCTYSYQNPVGDNGLNSSAGTEPFWSSSSVSISEFINRNDNTDQDGTIPNHANSKNHDTQTGEE
jgi:hypothetical protein